MFSAAPASISRRSLGSPELSPPTPLPPPAPLNFASRIFLGAWGLRAGWRLLLFFIALAISLAILGAPLGIAHSVFERHASLFRSLGNLVSVLAVFAATWLMIRIDRGSEPGVTFARAGLSRPAAFRNAAAGLVCGFFAISALMGILIALGLYTVRSPQWTLPALGWAVYWALQFVCTGFFEEMTMRGYSLSALTQGIGFWPSAILLSILFGAGHLGNGGEEWLGILNAVLAGIVFAYSVRVSGSLWWAIAAHAAWDWGETYFWGVSDSGVAAPNPLFTGIPHGNALLSGGSVGPEGSVFCIAALALLAGMVVFTTVRTSPLPWTRLSPLAPENLSIVEEGPSVIGGGPGCQFSEDG
jgi:membrane protease YdiL (CAAX protease family)